jgi:hypothetical protein
MQLTQFRLRTLMVSIAFLGFVLTIMIQAIRLQSALLQVQQLRASLARVDPEAAWAQASDESHRFWSSPQNQQRWAGAMNYERYRMSTQHNRR